MIVAMRMVVVVVVVVTNIERAMVAILMVVVVVAAIRGAQSVGGDHDVPRGDFTPSVSLHPSY